MSEQDVGLDSSDSFAGYQLVEARESLGLTAEAIQRELRLTSRVVAAIESGDLTEMGQPVFARGYIRAYCKRVGLDPEVYVEQYDSLVGEAPTKRSRIRSMASGSAATPNSMTLPNTKKGGGSFAGLFKLIVLLALLGGVGYGVTQLNLDLDNLSLPGMVTEDSPAATNELVIPGTQSTDVSEPEAPVEPAPDAEPTAVAEEPTVETLLQQPQATTESARVLSEELPAVQTEVVSSIESVMDESTAETQSLQANMESAPERVDAESIASSVESSDGPSVPTAGETAVEQAPVAAVEPEVLALDDIADSGLARVSISFNNVSWVNIKDGRGVGLFNGLAERDRTLELTGQPPVNFVIGRADAVSSLTFNGSVVDLEPYTRKNVARFMLP